MPNNRVPLSGPSRPAGPLTRLVAAVAAAFALVIAFLAGVVLWVLLAGVVLIGGVVLSVWFWRQRRKFEKFARQSQQDVIDAEYTVIDEKERDV
ncbi:MAG: DUF4381 domain-containing protein [Gammaproteobacteria bacterium]|nr:DUF4381 domain-containing protein [Gammaproteobacteria bacterium]NNF67015.1 hypothetical protein [Gammaproteobacteria bacterium]